VIYTPKSVKHFLLECAAFNNVRRNYYTVSTLKELFECVGMRQIIDIIKDINFCHCV